MGVNKISADETRARIAALESSKNPDGTYNATRAAKLANIPARTMRDFAARNENLLTTEAAEVGFPPDSVTNYWVKTKEGSYHVKRDVQVDVIQTIKEHFTGYQPKPAPKVAAPKNTDADTLTLYPLADLHLGLLAWGKEAERDWDLPIAIEAYQKAMQRVADASPASERAIILGGGDLLHTTDYSNKTQSGNFLDVDSRFPKILKAAIDLLIFQINIARKNHKFVTVRILPGNHDITAAIAVTYALHGYFRNDIASVQIDLDPGLFWFYPFEKTLIGATHGHAAKLADMPLIMANRVPDAWAASRHRYLHGFHLHNRQKHQHMFEAGGVITETHQSPAAQDAWHYGKGYLSGRSMQSITYHREHGEVARSTVAMV